MQKEEKINFLKYYVKPHNKISRDVEKKDLKTLIKDANILYNLCFTRTGFYNGGFAVAHQQINKKDPLRFFVTHKEEIIVNPVIVKHTKTTVDSQEGCLSFPDKRMITVQRWYKCVVRFQTLSYDEDKKEDILSDFIEKNLKGKDAFIYQHEIGHFDCDYIFET